MQENEDLHFLSENQIRAAILQYAIRADSCETVQGLVSSLIAHLPESVLAASGVYEFLACTSIS